jgi:hypothetical protein
MAREQVAGHQPEDLPTAADHDLGIEGKPACDFNAQLRAADRLPDHEGTRRADADGIEVLQLFGEPGGSEGPVTADVEAPYQKHECHELILAGASTEPIRGERPQPDPMSAQCPAPELPGLAGSPRGG